MQNLEINSKRLWDTIIETARFGITVKGGICRQTLTAADRQVRDWFVNACTDIGCAITVDDMGNTFACREGKNNALPPIAIGSHLDTQPSGGKFDGIVGVLSGLEVLRTLHDAGYITNAPIEVINWTNEEGSRFAPPMVGSGVFAGVFSHEFAFNLHDREGKKFHEELECIGYKGKTKCGNHKLDSYIELHIEQGPVLGVKNKLIGIVTGAQGMRWYEVTVTGYESHAGCTPMQLRKDAMLGCARMIEGINQLALNHAPLAVSTVGLVEVRPNSRNVIPGAVLFSVDLRHPDSTVLQQMDSELVTVITGIATDLNLGVQCHNNWYSPSVDFDERYINVVRAAVERLRISHCDIISGAGHDAVYVSRVAPTVMVFIPCENGISHNEQEKAEPDHVAAGANVLLNTIITRDKNRLKASDCSD